MVFEFAHVNSFYWNYSEASMSRVQALGAITHCMPLLCRYLLAKSGDSDSVLN